MKILNLGTGGAEGFILYTLFFIDHVYKLPDRVICVSASSLAFYFVFILSDHFHLFTRAHLRNICMNVRCPSKFSLLLCYEQLMGLLQLKIPNEAKEYTFAQFHENCQQDLTLITTRVGILTFSRKLWNYISEPNAKIWEVVMTSCNVVPTLIPNSHIDGWYSGDYDASDPNDQTLLVRIRKDNPPKRNVLYLDWSRRYQVCFENMIFSIAKHD